MQALGQQVRRWQGHRKTADSDAHGHYLGRQATQLQAVTTLLDGSLEVMAAELAAIDVDAPVGEVALRSRQLDDAVVWLERVWRYFGQRFDQRDASNDLAEAQRAAVVKAADEVVWSCYRVFYEHPRIAVLDLPKRPPPLAYIEPEYSPAIRTGDSAIGRQLEPSTAIKILDEIAGQIPMPLLRLPPWCVGAPWWLVFIAHEVGHQLQHELKLVEPFRLAIEEVAQQAGANPADAKRWGRWGEEIFADQCSLLLMGPWALWALVEVEQGPAAEMTRRRGSYPSPWVRLHGMARTAEALGLDATSALRGLDLTLPAEAAAELKLDMDIAEALVPLVGRSWSPYGKLAKLLRFNATEYAAGGEVELWASRLLSDQPLTPRRHLDCARELIAASVAAWARLGDEASDAELADGTLAQRAATLAQRTVDAVTVAAPEGTRSAAMPDGESTEVGRLLGSKLLALAVERRVGEGGGG